MLKEEKEYLKFIHVIFLLNHKVDLEVLQRELQVWQELILQILLTKPLCLQQEKIRKMLRWIDFEEAKDKVMMGMERKSLIITEEEKKTTSYHEIGHVLVARMIPEADPVHKVTIIPRGRALGVTSYLTN